MKVNQQSISEFPACERAEGSLRYQQACPEPEGQKKGGTECNTQSSIYAHVVLGDFLEPWHFWNILRPSARD